jgi:exonuclease III
MFKWILLLSLFANIIFADTECPIVSSIGDRRTDKNKLRLLQYNVEWLFIDYYSSMKCPGDGCTWKNLTEAEIHMDYVSKRIQALNPDIINFCEVEGCDELNILKDKLDGTYVSYLKKGTDSATGQNVGMLTRIDPLKSLYRTELKYSYPILGSNCGYTGSVSSSGVSKHYITEFLFNGINIAFISAHLIAIPTDSSRCAQREAQASVLQTIIVDYINRSYEVIMIGDFNDYDGEVLDVNSHKPTSQVLDILKGYKGDFAGQYQLYSAAETIVQSERYSDWWDSDNNCNTASKYDYSMIDHILVTDAIRKNIANVFIYHEYNEYCGKYDSDHYPVVVDLLI